MDKELAVQNKEVADLSVDIIKKYICPTATDQEAYFFLQLCAAQNLNPFLREAYLIKYGTAPATLVTGKETFTKRADRQPQFNGYKSGIIVAVKGALQYREGALLLAGESLLGGWAEVSRKDRDNAYRIEVTLSEYIGKKADGTTNAQWTTRPATMIRKVALVQALREAFPDAFGGMYSEEEAVAAVPSQEHSEQRPPIQRPRAVGEVLEAEVQPAAEPKPSSHPVDVESLVSEAQANRFYAIAKKTGASRTTVYSWFAGRGVTNAYKTAVANLIADLKQR